jgi:hypothetical protein
MHPKTKLFITLLACSVPLGEARSQACLSSASLSKSHAQLALTGSRLTFEDFSLDSWGLQATLGTPSVGFVSVGYIDSPVQKNNADPVNAANAIVGHEFRLGTSSFEACPLVSFLWQKASDQLGSQSETTASFGGAVGGRIAWGATTMFVPSLQAQYDRMTSSFSGVGGSLSAAKGTIALSGGIEFNQRVTVTPSIARWVGILGPPFLVYGLALSYSLGGAR